MCVIYAQMLILLTSLNKVVIKTRLQLCDDILVMY